MTRQMIIEALTNRITNSETIDDIESIIKTARTAYSMGLLRYEDYWYCWNKAWETEREIQDKTKEKLMNLITESKTTEEIKRAEEAVRAAHVMGLLRYTDYCECFDKVREKEIYGKGR